jgi:uncharacterized secreted protein with C-terminal beta-propeller domain
MDEREGHLRVVTSTEKRIVKQGFDTGVELTESASLFVVNLESGETIASVENFAPKGEEVASVRFDGDKLYVCTAVMVSFTDPVYFFDLSDYENILFSDTGVIEGYSTSLINLGNGFSLGIGVLDWRENKVSVYEQQGDSVVAVDEFIFSGNYSESYKSYLVNREESLFGFGVNLYYDEQLQRNVDVYILLHFDGYNITANVFNILSMYADSVRAAYIDGYLYITTVDELEVRKIK